MDLEISEIAKAVESIETDIYESTGVEYLNVSLITNGYVTKVKFIGVDIWCSEDDCRLGLYEDGGIPVESIEACLRRCINEELMKIALIKI